MRRNCFWGRKGWGRKTLSPFESDGRKEGGRKKCRQVEELTRFALKNTVFYSVHAVRKTKAFVITMQTELVKGNRQKAPSPWFLFLCPVQYKSH